MNDVLTYTEKKQKENTERNKKPTSPCVSPCGHSAVALNGLVRFFIREFIHHKVYTTHHQFQTNQLYFISPLTSGRFRAIMRSGTLPRRFLAHFIILLVLQVPLDNAENLEFYQDVEPERPRDVYYEEMARYLEAEKLANIRDESRNRLSSGLPWGYAEYLHYQRQKEKKLLEAFLENPSVLDALELQRQAKERAAIAQSPMGYDVQEVLGEVNEPEMSHPYSRPDPLSKRFEDFTNLKNPYAKNIFRNEKPRYPSAPERPSRIHEFSIENYPEQTSAERLLNIEGKLVELNRHRVVDNDEEILAGSSEQDSPEFTYKFDEAKTEERKFAVIPNDPRYYEKDDSSTEAVNEKTTAKQLSMVPPLHAFENQDRVKESDDVLRTDAEHSTENIRKDKFSIMKIVLPESHRLTDDDDDDDVIVSSSRLMTNDIYFIAIVAGCSAAAMFALVLISLTWCRLQRGAKAAADIEYPAYGVTGPNKDISPSGDQRLAHSAQMYHFQHQKQQIIAMENRTAASRDPGSVSEAESDEENEEGDYTVYECPGLASAGEMEVKNPMFRDDPTPASPQIHKQEDHI